MRNFSSAKKHLLRCFFLRERKKTLLSLILVLWPFTCKTLNSGGEYRTSVSVPHLLRSLTQTRSALYLTLQQHCGAAHSGARVHADLAFNPSPAIYRVTQASEFLEAFISLYIKWVQKFLPSRVLGRIK